MECRHCSGTIREIDLDWTWAGQTPDTIPSVKMYTEYIHVGCLIEEQADLTEQETDLPRTLMDAVMRDLQAANLYFILDNIAVPNYRYCTPETPVYVYRIGAWRQVEP